MWQQAHHPEFSLVQKSLRQAIKYIQRRFQWPRPHRRRCALDQPYQIQELRSALTGCMVFISSRCPPATHRFHSPHWLLPMRVVMRMSGLPYQPRYARPPFGFTYTFSHCPPATCHSSSSSLRMARCLPTRPASAHPMECSLRVDPVTGIHDPRDEVMPRHLKQYAHPAELMTYGHVPWLIRTLQGYRQLREVPSVSECPSFTEHVARWFQYQIGIKPESRASIQSLQGTPVSEAYAAIIIYWARAYLALQHNHWGISPDQGVWVSELCP